VTQPMRYWPVIAILTIAVAVCSLASHGEAVLLPKPLAIFPRVIGTWEGQDLPLDSRVIRGLAVDDYLNRVYHDSSGNNLALYVGYYKSQRKGATIHSPKNCLPGAGWEPVSAGHVELGWRDGEPALVNLYEIQKGINRQIVLYWYESHGRIVASEYSAKMYMVLDSIRLNRTDAALVRIAAPVDYDTLETRQRAVSFGEQILVQLNNLIP